MRIVRLLNVRSSEECEDSSKTNPQSLGAHGVLTLPFRFTFNRVYGSHSRILVEKNNVQTLLSVNLACAYELCDSSTSFQFLTEISVIYSKHIET